MGKPFFSVVVPTLNEERLLPRLMDSLVRQTYSGFEVIVVDAKSKDRTVAKAKKFGKILPNFRIYISRKKNAGWQRNLGAAKAKGKYLVFFDADAQISEDFLDQIFRYLKKRKVRLLTTWVKVENKKFKNQVVAVMANLGFEVAKMINMPYAGGSNIIVDKRVFEQVGGFDGSIIHGEDHEFTIRCNSCGTKLNILKYPRIILSTRRFDKYGLLDVWKKQTVSFFCVLFGKPLRKPIFDYQMGGENYK